MARSGNAADWQRRLAAQRQESERLARERRQRERAQDKGRQLEHVEAEPDAADKQTVADQEQVKSLDKVLTSVLTLPPVSFDQLMAAPQTPAFDPGPLGVAGPGPDWSDFAPAQPRGLRPLLRGGARYK